MNLIRQGPNQCGQCCIAMVTGRSLAEVIEVTGEGKLRLRTIVQALHHFGIKTGYLTLIINGVLPDYCIAGLQWNGGTHWIVKKGNDIYDPGLGMNPVYRNCWFISFVKLKGGDAE